MEATFTYTCFSGTVKSFCEAAKLMFQFIFQTIRLQFLQGVQILIQQLFLQPEAQLRLNGTNQIIFLLFYSYLCFRILSLSLSLSLSLFSPLSVLSHLSLSLYVSVSLSYVYVSFFLCFSPGSLPLSILFFYYVLFSNLCHVVLWLVAKWPSCSNSHISMQQFKANLVKKFYFQTCKRTSGLTSQTKPVLHSSTFQLIYLLAPPALNL